MAGGTLIQARVRITWGDINLSKYDGPDLGFPKDEPIAYDVRVDLSSENEGPNAEMKWNPTGPAMKVYEYLTKNYMNRAIVIEFFYTQAQGKKMPLIFMWSGQTINYGNDMSVTVKMVSELAGKINANIRSTAQAYQEKVGADPFTVLNRSATQYAVETSLFKYNPGTAAHWKTVRLENMYGSDWTLGNNAAQIAKQTGDSATGVNIGETSVVFFPPFSYPGTKPNNVNIATTTTPKIPSVTERYGFILGPSIIDSVSRQSLWKPPQQDDSNRPGTQPRARDARGRFTSQNPATTQQINTAKTAVATPSPLGSANNRPNLSILNAKNPQGPTRSNYLNDERGSELQLDTVVCPLLLGIKPHDILYLPSLTGEFIEDWIVQSVSYSQNNGQLNLSLQATRTYGLGTPMNKPEADKFQEYAKANKLIGPGATLEAWDRYAWYLPGSAAASASN